MLTINSENIVALATSPGKSALAIVRLSGPNLYSTYKAFSQKNPVDRRAVFTKIYHPQSKKLLDEAIIIYFKSPNSFTGEDVIEISCHGGSVVPHSIIRAAIDIGVRNASPGEFSFRAFLNGKMDLLQAEAISSLISSKSQLSADVSLQHLLGRVSTLILEIKDEALDVLSIIENELNFSEEELDLTSYSKIKEMVIHIQQKLVSILKNSAFGREALTGIRVVILGKPNSGKSSLFNAIIGFNRAIVSKSPGTTRDSIEYYFELEGISICLVDTAGVWESDEFLDRLGVQKTLDALDRADLCLLVDDSNPSKLLKSTFSDKISGRCLLIKTKCDLDIDPEKLDLDENTLLVSAEKEIGIGELLTCLSTFVVENINNPTRLDHVFVTRRQRKLLDLSFSSIKGVIGQIDLGTETDVLASSLRGFAEILKDVIGEIPNEDVINNIFSNFCVGK